ncbi:MAG: mercuric transporter MerT family protein [Pseudohongiella sp.]
MEVSESKTISSSHYITAGLLASATASICCLGPFALMATGISGAWMSRLMVIEPMQPFIIALTMLFFALAGWKIFYPTKKYEQGSSCPAQSIKSSQKFAYFLAGSLASILVSSEYWIVWIAG